MNLTHVLKQPIITEKSIKDASTGVFTFLVDTNASKPQIKAAVESGFNVKVVSVNTLKHKGKAYRVGRTRIIKQKSDQKIAKVRLQSGQSIDLFEVEEN